MSPEQQIVENVEVFAAGTRGGEVITTTDLRTIAQGSADVPLRVGTEDGPVVGRVARLRVLGDKLLATVVALPPRIAAAIRTGRFTTIATQLYIDKARGLRAVILSGGDLARLAPEPVGPRGDAGGSATAIKRYVFAMRGAACAQEHEETEMDRFEQTDAVRPEDIDAAVVARVRAYQAQDPSLTFEDGYRQLAQRDPDVWRLYGGKTYATLGTVAVSPAEQRAAADWHEAGLEVLRLADAYQQEHPERSRTQAIHAVFRDKDNAALIRRYLRGSNPPGT